MVRSARMLLKVKPQQFINKTAATLGKDDRAVTDWSANLATNLATNQAADLATTRG